MASYFGGSVEIQIKSTADQARASLEALRLTIQGIRSDLQSLSPVFANINKLTSQLQNISKIDTSKAVSQINAVGDSIGKMSNSLARTDSTPLNALKMTHGVNQAKKAMVDLGKESKITKSAVDSVFSIGKIYFFLNYTKRAVQSFSTMLKSAIDFVEVENLFSRSMGNMRAEAILFQNTMAETFGLALPDMMKSQALFNNIVKQLGGINEQMSAGISETLTEMAIDFSALYNVQIEKAFDTFQAAMTGQVKPVRRIAGMDITQQTLQTFLDEAGIQRTIRSLNQVEKRILTVYSLQRQMAESGAIGNYAETIENAANQLKILSEQVKEFGRWMSSIFLASISKALPYLNGFVMVLKEIAKTLAFFVGYKLPETTDLNDALGLEETIDGLDDAADGVEKIKQATTGIDEFNIISPKQAGAGAGEIVDPAILGLLTEYDNLMAGVRMKALDIRDAIMEWLGFTQKINKLTGEISWNFNADKLITNIEALIGIDLDKLISSLNNLWSSLKPFAKNIGEGLVWLWRNFFIPVGKWTLGKALPALLDVLSAFFKTTQNIIKPIASSLADFYKNFLAPVGNWAGQIIVNLLSELSQVITSIGEWAQKYSGLIKTATDIIIPFLSAWLIVKTITGIQLFSDAIANIVTAVLNFKYLPGVVGGFLDDIGSKFSAFMATNWPLILATAIIGIGIAVYQIVKDIEQSRFDRIYAEIFGNVEYSIGQLQKAIGTFSESSTVDLAKVTEKLKPETEQWRDQFIESSNNFQALVDSFGTGSKIITEETLPTIMTSLETMSNDLRTQIDEEKNYQLQFWTAFYKQNDGVVDAGEQAIIDTIVAKYGDKHLKVDKLEKDITQIYRTEVDEQGRLTEEGLQKVNDLIAKYNELANFELSKANAEHMLLLDDLKTGRIKITEDTYKNYIQAVKEGEKEAVALAQENRVEALRLAVLGVAEGTAEYAKIMADVNAQYDKDVANIGLKSQEALKSMADQVKTLADPSIKAYQDMRKEYDEQGKSIDALMEYQKKLGDEMKAFKPVTDAEIQQLQDMQIEYNRLYDEIKNMSMLYANLGEELSHTQKDTKTTFEIVQGVLDDFIAAQNKIVEDFGYAGSNAGIEYMSGLELGFKDTSDKTLATWDEMLNSLINNSYDTLGIKSPSTITQDMGHQLNAGLAIGVADTSYMVIDAFKMLFNKILRNLQTFSNTFLKGWYDTIVKMGELSALLPDAPKIKTPSLPSIKIPEFRTGGFPEDGLFFANHTELIGSVAGRTAVANNDQIVAAVSQGVAQAVAAVFNAQQPQQDNRPISIVIDGREVVRAVRNNEQAMGANPIGGDFALA